MDRTLQRCESEHKWGVDSLSARQEYYRDREAYARIEEQSGSKFEWVSFLWVRRGDVKGMGLEWMQTLVETNSYTAITWDLLTWNASIEEIKRYIKEHPMPKSVVYKNEAELIEDIENASGIITVADNENEEFKKWFIELAKISL